MARDMVRDAEAGRESDHAWQRFVLTHGARTRNVDLSAVLGRSVEEIAAFREKALAGCGPGAGGLGFEALFQAWHGRPPEDSEWRAPVYYAGKGTYEWLPPELTLIGTLVGQLSVDEIAQVLTERLRAVTGDPKAARDRMSVQNHISRMGLVASDVLGGITLAAAGKEVGSYAVVQQAVRDGRLPARRVGRLWVVPHAAWAEWKEQVKRVPEGFVKLSTLRAALGIASDSKLPEFATMGYVPEAIQVKPFAKKDLGRAARGTWYIPQATADQLLADRHAGRPMPWHGKPMRDNLKVTYRLWLERRHPESCATCAQIWGEGGPPQDFNGYVARYAGLAHGSKRHLTMAWQPGWTLKELAAASGKNLAHVRRAVANGALHTSTHDQTVYVSRTDATLWMEHRCPDGEAEDAWISEATAAQRFLFSRQELQDLQRRGELKHRVGTAGAMRGICYVSRFQCAHLREQRGYTLEQAAARAKVSVDKMRQLLEGVNWRGAQGIPLVTVQAAIKRAKSSQGLTVEEAAEALAAPLEWVLACIEDGLVVVRRNAWDDRAYLTRPMMERLRNAQFKVPRPEPLSADWLRVSAAAAHAGVSSTTVQLWGETGDVQTRAASNGLHYHLEDLRARARSYWQTTRQKRLRPPAWLRAEFETGVITQVVTSPPPASQPWTYLERVSVAALIALRAKLRGRQGKPSESKRRIAALLTTQFSRLKDMDTIPFVDLDAGAAEELAHLASEFTGSRVALPKV